MSQNSAEYIISSRHLKSWFYSSLSKKWVNNRNIFNSTRSFILMICLNRRDTSDELLFLSRNSKDPWQITTCTNSHTEYSQTKCKHIQFNSFSLFISWPWRQIQRHKFIYKPITADALSQLIFLLGCSVLFTVELLTHTNITVLYQRCYLLLEGICSVIPIIDDRR